MNVVLKSQASKISSAVATKKTNTPKIVLGLGKNLADIDYDMLFENKPKQQAQAL